MKKLNFLIFFNILLIIPFVQLSKQNLPLNHPRKLEDNKNETILLGYDNYNYSSNDEFIYFDTYFYLKNWNKENITFMEEEEEEENYYKIEAMINYQTKIETTNFTCKNDYEWFKEKNIYYPCNEDGYCFAKYTCELNITGKGVPRKINITTNYTEKVINKAAKVSYVSSSAEALERELTSLKYRTLYFEVLENATFISQNPNSFKIKGKELYEEFNSENIYLITNVNGNPKKVLCSGKYETDSNDDDWYFLQSKGSNNLAGADLQYALLNFTKANKECMAILDFYQNVNEANGTILPVIPKNKKNSGGLSTGGIVGILIPTCIVVIGVAGLVFFLSRGAVPPPPPKNITNQTIGVASTEAIVHQ